MTLGEIETLIDELLDSGWCAETEARRKMARAADALRKLVAARAARDFSIVKARGEARSVVTRFQGFDCVVWFRVEGAPPANELLISIGKPGSQIEAMAREISSVFNAARAAGVPFEWLRACAGRDSEGEPATIFAHALDVVSHEMKGSAS